MRLLSPRPPHTLILPPLDSPLVVIIVLPSYWHSITLWSSRNRSRSICKISCFLACWMCCKPIGCVNSLRVSIMETANDLLSSAQHCSFRWKDWNSWYHNTMSYYVSGCKYNLFNVLEAWRCTYYIFGNIFQPPRIILSRFKNAKKIALHSMSLYFQHSSHNISIYECLSEVNQYIWMKSAIAKIKIMDEVMETRKINTHSHKSTSCSSISELHHRV